MTHPETRRTGLWPIVDRGTRQIWRVTGRPVDLDGAESWLQSPHNRVGESGNAWLDRFAAEGRVTQGSDAGLLPTMAALDGPRFRSADLLSQIRDFYEHTSAYDMQVWSQWTPGFGTGGALITRLFGRRIGQLALPIEPLAMSRGVSNTIRQVAAPDGSHLGTAWIRTLLRDGSTMYGGFYRDDLIPSSSQPHVHVSFPLEDGGIEVFLAPSVGADGTLLLRSHGKDFGGEGAYVVARSGGRWHAARVALHERFHMYVDDAGVLRTDHTLRVGPVTALRMHYRLDRVR